MDKLITKQYFKQYREKLGFTNQYDVKNFFSGKDITTTIDYNYINLLNIRLIKIIKTINTLTLSDINEVDIDEFCNKNIKIVFNKLQNNNIIQKLNNQGRRPEQVYFSWMRGHIIVNYFLKTLSKIFEVNIQDISLIGGDDLVNIELFKKNKTADLEITLKNGQKLRIEVQSGFVGINDIKQHKILEAKKNFRIYKIESLVIHFDLFNGQVAFIKLNEIEDDSINWITRQQMEGQTVFNIDQNYFIWKLTENPPLLNELFID